MYSQYAKLTVEIHSFSSQVLWLQFVKLDRNKRTCERAVLAHNRSNQNQKKRTLNMIETNLNRALLDAVDSGLLVLGENSRMAIYFHLDKTFKIKREEIAKKFGEFKKALENIFGPSAEIIKAVIKKELRTRLDLDFEEIEGFELANYVDVIQEIRNVKRSKKGKLQ